MKAFSSIGITRRPKPSKFESLYSTEQLDAQIKQLKTVANTLEDNLRRKKIARDRYFVCYEDDDFDKAELSRKLKENDNDMRKIKSEIEKTENKLITLSEANHNIESFKELIENNPEWVYSLQRSLYELSPKDKKLLIENLVQGKIWCQIRPRRKRVMGNSWLWNFVQ